MQVMRLSMISSVLKQIFPPVSAVDHFLVAAPLPGGGMDTFSNFRLARCMQSIYMSFGVTLEISTLLIAALVVPVPHC
jgi:hypothetical protein